MKNIYYLVFCLFLTITLTAQKKADPYTPSDKPTKVFYPKSFHVTPPMRDMPVCDDLSQFTGKVVPKDGVNTSHEMSNKRKRKLAHLNSAGRSNIEVDPLIVGPETFIHSSENRAPIANFESTGLDSSPPDPSMAVGPNHVVTMENGVWSIYDKNGNVAPGWPKPLNDPLSGPNHTVNSGDPVVMYDREADRWFISQFQLPSADVFLVGVSTSPDPTGSYNVYEYELGQGNDYPHYGVWGDSYVAAGNFSGAQKVYTFNRTKMLAGNATAEIAGFSPAGLGVGGFAAPIPVHSEGAGDATGDIKIVYYQDDAFFAPGTENDHIGLWNIDMDWSNIAGSTISAKQKIPTAAFDAAIAGGFSNLQQPGTSQRIDAIVGAVMNMSHWYKFATHESIVLNWVVEVTNGSQISGIRWVELRSTNGGTSWSVYQEGTFTDPSGNESVFMGCIGMDAQGNIGLGYTKTGPTTFPSLYYTGRLNGDALGTMTVPEQLVIAGTHAVTNNDRYGDYGQGVIDPTDDLTFWVTSEYSGSQGATNCCDGDRKVRVYSYKLAPEFTTNVGITAIVQPTSGPGLSSNETVQVTIENSGTAAASNIPVNFSIDGVLVGTETFTGTIASGASANYTFTTNFADLSTQGQTYVIEACTALAGDESSVNDCISKNVEHQTANDVSVIAITSPTSDVGLTASETVIITLQNIGTNAQSNIPISYNIDGGTSISATFSGTIASGNTASFTFTPTADLSITGGYTLCAKTALVGDQNTTNDEICSNIVNLSCTGEATTTGATACNSDGIKRLILGTIDIDDGSSGCNTEPADGPVGYVNRTYLSTDLDRVTGLNTHILQAQTNWNTQNLSVWIDFNDNGVFETSEILINQAFTIEDDLESFNLTIPTNALLGSHIIRLKSFDSGAAGDATDPCGDVAYGETHDYTVNIIDSTLGACQDTTTYTTSWSNGFPTPSKNAIINGTYSTSAASIDACSLVVNGTLNVSANTYINIINNIDVTASGTINVVHTGSVVQFEDTATVNNAGAINVAVSTPNLDVLDFMIMGSPMDTETRENVWVSAWNVQNYTPENFNPIAAVTDAYNFADEEIDDWNLYTTGILGAGEGFLVRPQTSHQGAGGIFNYTYNTGTLNNGVVTRPLNFNTVQLDSPNMLSNPYASAINADVFLAANPEIDALYFWEHNTAPGAYPGHNVGANYTMGDVSFYNAVGPMAAATGGPIPTNIISTAQGFGTFANATGTATFNNSMRITGPNNTLRSTNVIKNRLWLQVVSDTYTIKGSTLIGFLEGATQGFESKYDSQRMATHVSIFSHIGTSDVGYAVQGREAFENDMTVSVGFSSIIDEVTSYTISLSDFDGIAFETNIPYVLDTVTGILTNLKENSYTFTSGKGVYNNRFIVQFKNNALNNTDFALENIKVFPNPVKDVLTINSPSAEILKIEVIDILGRKVIENTPNTTTTQINLSSQKTTIYFVKITTSKGVITKKIIKK